MSMNVGGAASRSNTYYNQAVNAWKGQKINEKVERVFLAAMTLLALTFIAPKMIFPIAFVGFFGHRVINENLKHAEAQIKSVWNYSKPLFVAAAATITVLALPQVVWVLTVSAGLHQSAKAGEFFYNRPRTKTI